MRSATHLGVSLASWIIATQVYAQITCGPPNQTIGQVGKDHVVSSHVWHDKNDKWIIIHNLSDGTSVHRELQYDIIDESLTPSYWWRGHLKRNPSMEMTAGAQFVNKKWYYRESLAYNGKVIMESEADCTADYPIASEFAMVPQIPIQKTPPTATPIGAQKSEPAQAQAVEAFDSTSTPFSIAIIPIGSHGGKAVDITLGADTVVTMIIDTGSDILEVTESVANKLLSNNEAKEAETVYTTLADGSIQRERTININKLIIGGHVLYNIPAAVGSDVSQPLLGIDVLSRFGTFKIETTKNLLILG